MSRIDKPLRKSRGNRGPVKPSEYLDRKFSAGVLRKCWMCDIELTRGTATVDHLQSRSRGGSNRATNLRLACGDCNSARGSRKLTADEWSKALGVRKRQSTAEALATAIQAARKRTDAETQQ